MNSLVKDAAIIIVVVIVMAKVAEEPTAVLY